MAEVLFLKNVFHIFSSKHSFDPTYNSLDKKYIRSYQLVIQFYSDLFKIIINEIIAINFLFSIRV